MTKEELTQKLREENSLESLLSFTEGQSLIMKTSD